MLIFLYLYLLFLLLTYFILMLKSLMCMYLYGSPFIFCHFYFIWVMTILFSVFLGVF